MGSYSFEKPKKKKELSAGWRGIGCLLMIFLPVVSYYGAFLLLKMPAIGSVFAGAMPKLYISIPLPSALYKITFMTGLWRWVETQNTLLVSFILGSLILVLLFTFVSAIYSIMYRAVAPPKYGPTDAPPQKRRKGPRKYSR